MIYWTGIKVIKSILPLGEARRGSKYDTFFLDDQRLNHYFEKNMTSAASTQTFRDGRPVLSGFVLSDQPVAQDLWSDYELLFLGRSF